MHDLTLWLKDELDDSEVRQIATALDESHPEFAEGIRDALEEDGEGAEFLRSLPKLLGHDMFEVWESLGIHVTPAHWSSPIANVRDLSDDLWDGPSEMPELDFRIDDQLDRLSTFESEYRGEYSDFPILESSGEYNGFAIQNNFFESVDTEVAYSMVREHEPKRVIEIGGGNSTQVLDAALKQNDQPFEHLIIEPEPSQVITGVDAKIIQSKVQEVPMSVFESLTEDDVLFIDSTHVGKIGSDVLYEYLDLLPQLDDGVLVHAHDIFLPYEYPKPWVMDQHWFFNEQYLLRALLSGSDDEILWSTYYLHRQHPELLAEAFDSYAALGEYYGPEKPEGIPSSFWMRTNR
jgi:hypothetical protein